MAWLEILPAWLKLDFQKIQTAWLGLSRKFYSLAWLKPRKFWLDPGLIACSFLDFSKSLVFLASNLKPFDSEYEEEKKFRLYSEVLNLSRFMPSNACASISYTIKSEAKLCDWLRKHSWTLVNTCWVNPCNLFTSRFPI